MTTIKLLDTIAIVRDIPDLGLTAGEVGVVVELLPDDVFEVEFADESGRAYAMHTLRAEQVMVLHLRGNVFRMRPEAA